MTALINVEGALPRPLWALTRYLLRAPGRRQNLDTARALLSPASLFEFDTATHVRRDKEQVFDRTIKIATELKLLSIDDQRISLTDLVAHLDPDRPAGFFDVLRSAVLSRVNVAEIATDPSNTQGKDLIRALCFFTNLDTDTEVDINTFAVEQQGALTDDLRNPFANTARWTFFPYWASALGFADTPLLAEGGPVSLVPDCRVAVRQTLLSLGKKDAVFSAREVVTGLLEKLPVLPGGSYSTALGFNTGALDVAPSLASALLAAEDDNYATLVMQSDATDAITLADPDSEGGVRRVSRIQIGGGA